MAAISTQGWDTAFALRLPAVNAALAAAVGSGTLKLPAIEWSSKGWSMTGEFGAWQLTSEGLRNTGGSLVGMRFPIRRATLVGDGERYELSGAEALGTLQLALVSDGTLHKLVIDAKKGVQIREIRGGDPDVHAVFQDALARFLRQNLEAFKHAFAIVDLNDRVGREIPWLAPKAVGYCYSGGDDDAGSFLAVLCMTDDYVAGNPTPPATMAHGLIPQGAQCAFLLARKLFVRQLFLPGLVEGFRLRCDAATEKKLSGPALHSARQAHWFELQDQGARIAKRPRTGPIALGRHAVDVSWLYAVIGTAGGLGVNPWVLPVGQAAALVTFVGNLIARGKPAIMAELALRIDGLEVTTGDGEVSFKVSLHGDLRLPLLPWLFKDWRLDLATVGLEVTSTHAPELAADGKLHFKATGRPVHTDPVVQPAKWVDTAATVEKIVFSMIGTVLTVVTDGLAAGLFAAGAALSEGGLQLLSKGLALSAEDAAKKGMPTDFVSFVDTAISPVRWSGKEGLVPASIALGEALLIAGNPR